MVSGTISGVDRTAVAVSTGEVPTAEMVIDTGVPGGARRRRLVTGTAASHTDYVAAGLTS